MPVYIMLSSLTAQGVQTLKSNPDRLREVNRDVEELGAKVLHQWATLGAVRLRERRRGAGRRDDRPCVDRPRRPRERQAPDADGARDRGLPQCRELGLGRSIGDGDLGREPGVRDHELAVDAERSAAASLVQASEDERRHRRPGDALLVCRGERFLDQRLDVVDALRRRLDEQERRVALEAASACARARPPRSALSTRAGSGGPPWAV